MSQSVSWRRYDNEYDVSGLMTEAARACVSAHPTNVKDFFSRYFRQVANGTSVKTIRQEEVVSAEGEVALTFSLELCAGPEVTATTGDILSLSSAAVKDEGLSYSSSKEDVVDERNTDNSEGNRLQACCADVISALLEHGYVEPQSDWDSALSAACSVSWCDMNTSSIKWVLSIMASLVSAKQRCVPLHEYLTTLVEDCRACRQVPGGPCSTPTRSGVAGASKAQTTPEKPVGPYTIPQLLVTFLVNSAGTASPDAANGVRFSHVYVALNPLISSGGEEQREAVVAPVGGAELRQRLRKVRKAADRFRQTYSTSSHVFPGGILHWDGAANLSDVVKAVADALSAAELTVGTDVVLGLSMGASVMQVPVTDKTDGSVITDSSADRSMFYNLFGGGEPPVTGDQLSEYIKEQLSEFEPNVVQYLEDTHATDDGVARQRLQMAVQDFILLTDVGAVYPNPNPGDWGLGSPPMTQVQDGAFPNHVLNPCDCGSMSAAIEVMCANGEESHRILSVVIDSSAGDAQTAASIVDVAIAGGASYVIVKAGIYGPCTAAVTSRLASRTEDFSSRCAVAPLLSPQRFNRNNWPPLPTVEVKPIRRKGDKKKKESGKANLKRK